MINQIYIDVISLTAARIHLHKPRVMWYYVVHFTSNGCSYLYSHWFSCRKQNNGRIISRKM